jgi:prepilin-type N-terminal cleavage/methylation domain-containing protein
MLNKILLRKIKFPLSLRGAKQRSNLKGFSLIELMVAAVILALAIFGIFQAFSTGFLGMFDARDRTVATNYVQEKMEELKNADFDTVVDEASSQIVGDIKFSRNVNVEYIDGSTNLIVAGPTNLKRVITTVNWTDRNGVAKKVESSMLLQNTQFTPGDATRIFLYADPYNVVLPVTDSTTIIAVIKDKSGNTIFDWDGSDITFTIKSEVPVEGLGTLSDYSVNPVKGIAKVIFTSSGTDPLSPEGTVTVEASVTTSDGLNTFTDTIDIDVTWGAVKIELIPNPSSILANGESQSIITAIIQNAAGGKVTESTNIISFTVSGEGTLIGPTVTSPTEGEATILLQSTNIPGIATVTASSPELFSGSCDVRTSGEPAGITLSASPNPMYSDDISTVTVTIVDENGVSVIPTAGSITITLSTSEGYLTGESPLTFDGVSSQAMTFTPTITEGLATISANGTYAGSVEISVMQELTPHHIDLNANPPSIPADGISTSKITATIKNLDGITVHNYNEDVTFSILTGGGDLSVVGGVVSCSNGVASIKLYSGGIPGICQVQAVSGTLPMATIDVGFYTTADHILLTAVPVHIPVGGGNEGTTKLTAYVKDEYNVTVYNYKGNVLFTFEQGFNNTAKFKFVNNPNYSVPVFNGTASIYVVSLNNSGEAKLIAANPPLDDLPCNELSIYIEKTLKKAIFPNIIYDANNRGVSFDIEVLGGNIQINDMMVSWIPNNAEQLKSIKFGNSVVFSGSILSGQNINITDTVLPEGISTIYLGFGQAINTKEITIRFIPPTFPYDYNANFYEIIL